MNPDYIQPGRSVRTSSDVRPGDLMGSDIDAQLSSNRRSGEPGVIERPITRQGCDVWAVTHPDGTTAAYHCDELASLKHP